MIGAATIGIGFYWVMWAHVVEDNKMANENNENPDLVTSSSAPLLSTKSIDV